MKFLLHFMTFISLFGQPGFARILIIPGDANSIEEAVEKAANGDEIVVRLEEVKWSYRERTSEYGDVYGDPFGIKIQGKDLMITGGMNRSSRILIPLYYYPSSDSYFLWVENCRVSIRNLELENPPLSLVPRSEWEGGRTGAPIHVESGALELDSCRLTCAIEAKGDLSIRNCIIQGYSWFSGSHYNQHTLYTPTLLMGPASQAALQIRGSTVTSDGHDAYINVVVQNLQKSTVTLQNSHFTGGTYNEGGRYLPDPSGSHGFLIRDCTDAVVDVENSIFEGGSGYDATPPEGLGEVTVAGGGGAGLAIESSSVRIRESGSFGSTRGGRGGAAYLGLGYHKTDIVKRPAASGGPGLLIKNSNVGINTSNFESRYQARGGEGGRPALYQEDSIPNGLFLPTGPNGIPIVIDNDSSIKPLPETEE